MTTERERARLDAAATRIIANADRKEREARRQLLDPAPWLDDFNGMRKHIRKNRDQINIAEEREMIRRYKELKSRQVLRERAKRMKQNHGSKKPNAAPRRQSDRDAS